MKSDERHFLSDFLFSKCYTIYWIWSIESL